MTNPQSPPPMLLERFEPLPEALAPFIREVGRGTRGANDLTRDQAREAMGVILSGAATPAQIGAFFQAMRIKSETPDELAGMIDAVRARCGAGLWPAPDRDKTFQVRSNIIEIGVPYDGRLRAFHVLPFAARLAARAGVNVLVHGEAGVGPKFGVSIIEILHAAGVPGARSLTEALTRLQTEPIVWIDTPAYSPALAGLRRLRDEVVLRGPLATVEKMLNLSGAATLMAGNFHTPYAGIMSGAFERLREAWAFQRAWVIQGPEGHIDVDPRRRMTAKVVTADGIRDEMITPEMFGDAWGPRETLAPPDPPPVTDPRDLGQRARWIDANLEWGEAALAGKEPQGAAALHGTAALLVWAAGAAADLPMALEDIGKTSRRRVHGNES